MFRKFPSRTYYARRLILLPSTLAIAMCLLMACRSINAPDMQDDHSVGSNEMIVLDTDTAEWHLCLIASGLIYENAIAVNIPAPWMLPTREDAKVLKDLTFPNKERFVTSDGYTFGMPSASVTKAGAKTKYSVLGLWKRRTTIEIEF